MKKILILFFILVPALLVNAEFVGPDASPQYNSVKEVLSNPVDDAIVVLKGRIIKKINKKKYVFEDDTGQITVEISYKKMIHLHITPKTLVEINGEIDIDRFPRKTIEIDVKYLRILSKE